MPAMPKPIEFCLPTSGKAVPGGQDWPHEIKYDGLYEASRVKKFFEINIFLFLRLAA